MPSAMLIGQGFDAHRFAAGRPLVLGGVSDPSRPGAWPPTRTATWSSMHCATPCWVPRGSGDIGRHFPDTDAAYAGIDSRILLRRVMESLTGRGLRGPQRGSHHHRPAPPARPLHRRHARDPGRGPGLRFAAGERQGDHHRADGLHRSRARGSPPWPWCCCWNECARIGRRARDPLPATTIGIPFQDLPRVHGGTAGRGPGCGWSPRTSRSRSSSASSRTGRATTDSCGCARPTPTPNGWRAGWRELAGVSASRTWASPGSRTAAPSPASGSRVPASERRGPRLVRPGRRGDRGPGGPCPPPQAAPRRLGGQPLPHPGAGPGAGPGPGSGAAARGSAEPRTACLDRQPRRAQLFRRAALRPRRCQSAARRGPVPGRHPPAVPSPAGPLALRRALRSSSIGCWPSGCRRGDWDRPLPGDCLNLDGSHSFFRAEAIGETWSQRCERLDLHPTGPLWGGGEPPSGAEVRALEAAAADSLPGWGEGLARFGLAQERRALRLPVRDLAWELSPAGVELTFTLPAGAYATAVLRELIAWDPAEGA